MPDAIPSLKGVQYVLWLVAIVTIVLRKYYTIAMGAALVVGLLKRAGMVQFSTEFVQRAIFQDDFQMLGFLGVAAMVGAVNFVVFLPFLLHAWITLGQISLDPSGVQPAIRGLINLLKSAMLAGPSHQQRVELKADVEVMLGFYLVIAWFFGMSNAVSILFYWQIMRLHYMLSYACQFAFTRFDQRLRAAVIDRAFCPGIVKKAYESIKGIMVGMGQVPDTQPQ
jgi:hypothetical protein